MNRCRWLALNLNETNTLASPPAFLFSTVSNAFLDSSLSSIYGRHGPSSVAGKSALMLVASIYQPIDPVQTNSPPSPQQSECGSVTPPSQTYLDTPPVLGADIFDTVPFSVRILKGRTGTAWS